MPPPAYEKDGWRCGFALARRRFGKPPRNVTLSVTFLETRAKGGRIVAVGTTACRLIESCAAEGNATPFVGETDIFIRPGYRFRVTDALITNFHLPKSTLMMLVSAFAGYDTIRAAYAHAIAARYRFFSYGDAMLLERSDAV